MNLQLSLIENWFRLTEKGIKKEDYREITPYWCNRFLLIKGSKKSKIWWHENFFQCRSIQKTIVSLSNKDVSFKKFKVNIMTLGYPKKTDSDRILNLEHKGIEIRTGNPEWGAYPNKLYFVIKHGTSLYKS